MARKNKIGGKNPLVSIIIPVRKIGEYVMNHVPKILEMDYKNIEIIIVSEAKETVKFPKTKVIKVGRVNPAGKRNAGVKESNGEIIAFIDDDAYPIKDWLVHAVKYFENDEIAAVAGPQIVPEESTFMQKVSGYVYSLGAGKQKYVYTPTKFQYIDDYPTCNLIVRRKCFEEINGFNTDYWGGEDTKLCYDLTQKLKKKMAYDPKVLVWHHRRKTARDHIKQVSMWAIYRGYFSRKFPETSLRLVYFVPPLFLLGVIFGGIASYFNDFLKMGYFSVISLYLLYCTYTAAKTKSIKFFFPVLFLLVATHLAYGLGMIRGILMKKSLDRTFHPLEKVDI